MARRPLHDPRGRDAMDKAALILAFLLGAGGSVALKVLGAPVLVAALWPVAVLVGYVLACLATRAIAIEPEAVGDNCYYLGFLFTLSSLAVTLYQIRSLGADGAAFIPQVISGFGVALSSTIAGVFLRVMLMQMRPDMVARDREARRDLAMGARDFRAAVTVATRSLRATAVEAAQHAAERNARLDEITDAHAARAAAMLARQAEAHEAAARSLADRLAADLGEAGLAAERLREASDRLAASLSDLAGWQAEGMPRLRRAQGAIEAGLEAWRRAAEGAPPPPETPPETPSEAAPVASPVASPDWAAGPMRGMAEPASPWRPAPALAAGPRSRP